MKHVKRRAIKAGFNYTAIPPYDQSLNEAEKIADRAWAAARTHLVSTGDGPGHMALAVDHVCYIKLRIISYQGLQDSLRNHQGSQAVNLALLPFLLQSPGHSTQRKEDQAEE